jgi:hypothetical protein
MSKYFLVIILSFLFLNCSSITYVTINNWASFDIIFESKISDNITQFEIIENDVGIYKHLYINNIKIIILLKTKIWNFDENIIIIEYLDNNIFKYLGYNNENIIDNYIQFIDYIFDEINICYYEDRILDKKYFLNKENIYFRRGLLKNKISYTIRL